MDELAIRSLIEDLRSGACSPDDAVARLRRLPFTELGFAKVDHHRVLRQGLPEAVYGPGKPASQCAAIVAERGWRPLLWSHWGRDWEARATPQSIVSLLTARGLRRGSVLLLHDADDYSAEGSWRRTAAALPRVLAELEARGMSWSLEV